jgi:hypothetical protein
MLGIAALVFVYVNVFGIATLVCVRERACYTSSCVYMNVLDIAALVCVCT